jgi:hypothetical protein
MAREEEDFATPEDYEDLVPALIARSINEAEQYCQLLNDHDIPAIAGESADAVEDDEDVTVRQRGISRGIPVLVPDVWLDEASEIIADREEIEGFEIDAEQDDEDKDEFGLNPDAQLDEALELEDEDDLFLEEDEEDEDFDFFDEDEEQDDDVF